MPLASNNPKHLKTTEAIINDLNQYYQTIDTIDKHHDALILPTSIQTIPDLIIALLQQKFKLYSQFHHRHNQKTTYDSPYVAIQLPDKIDATVFKTFTFNDYIMIPYAPNDVQLITDVLSQPRFLSELATVSSLDPKTYHRTTPLIHEHLKPMTKSALFQNDTLVRLLNQIKILGEITDYAKNYYQH